MTFATRRSLRRSQTIDYDELADTKIGLASMLPSTQPKRRGRPPKSSTSVLHRKLPGSKPRGRPPSTAPHIMTDERIALKLGWRLRTSVKMGKRVGDAARSVYLLSRQWPWDLVAGFKPKRWGIEILESMRKLFRIIHRVFTADEHRNDFQFVKNYLRGCAMKRDRRRPQLKNCDIEDACDYFAVGDNARRDTAHATVTGLKRSISTVVQEDEDGWLDFTGIGIDLFDDEDEDDEYVDIATPTKRSRTPSSPPLSPKRARTADPTETRQQTITDITNSLRSLHAQKQKEFEEVTDSLDKIAVSIQTKEVTQMNHINAKVDKLTSDVKAYESEREKILKVRGIVEQQHKDMKMKADHLLQHYTSQVEEYDRLIAQANDDVLEELDRMGHGDGGLEDEEKRLEGRVKEVLEEVRHCSVVETLVRLGPGGMAKLLGRLEGNGVELVEMAESIMNEAEE
ncbi:uncharacterized protein FSUBG_4717 [Fusarium subglutinans]|uniref:Uncharacterized protein n=1 Tax=Gibberella subglutinans TaxID=42677 RepID=A0A8H5Q620_GIBSU|nr:uncharacterized protein FSUBG_4717 [Fusarium subglutinans]KAF5608183.1 hypothetical protein FSUBG_4717 [Fusarium subglutinans]